MIKNYILIAWRNIKRQKGYSAINILGLAFGIAACILILQYVTYELSYENFQQKKDRLYRIRQDRYDNGKLSTQWAAGAYAIGNSFKEAIPEIEDYVKVIPNGQVIVTVQDQPVSIKQVFFASSSFFNLFTLPVKEGSAEKALTEPNTAAISVTTAKKIFGTVNAVGKSLELNRNSTYKITAVYEDAPVNTQLKPDILLSYATYISFRGPDNNPDQAWLQDGCLTYVLLKENADPGAVEAKFIPITEKFVAAAMKQYNSAVTYHLQPITDIHLYSHYMMEPGPTGDGETVYLLLGIAFVIIVIAWVNYINLATARAINRAKEVGVRKAIGSGRRQLVIQFLSESALLNSFAVLLALGLILLALPAFNRFSGQQLSFSLLTSASFWIGLGALFITGVFFSGLYPAFVLSGFRPIEVLKGKMVTSQKGALLRKGLVVFQFAASLFLLIGTMVVYRQLQYMRNQSLGIDIDQTLVASRPIVGIDSTYMQKIAAFKEILKQQSSISAVSISTSIPGEAVGWNAGGIKLVGTDESTQKQYRVIGVDYDYLGMYGIKIIAGRAFADSFGSDVESVIFNRKGIELLGFNDPSQAIGKKIDFWGRQYAITGVAENFHQQSLRESFEPLIFRLIPDIEGYISVRTKASTAALAVADVKKRWQEFFPGNTFDYFFLDEHFDDQYKADQRFGQVFGLFTALAILVACLGLFGLASFTTLQRTKEIGIRKVLGASVAGILKLLYKEFALLLAIAFVIAVPLSWYMVSKWLQGYAFRIDIQWMFFVVPFIVIAMIALLTVSFQSIKAALANPVKSLRTE